MVYSSSIAAPRLNIAPFLDEHEATQTATVVSSKQKNKSCQYLTQLLLLLLIALLSAPFLMFTLQRIEAKQDFTLNQALVNDLTAYLRQDIYQPVLEVSTTAWKRSARLVDGWKKDSFQGLDSTWKTAREVAETRFKDLGAFLGGAWAKYWPQTCQMVC